MKIHTQTKKGYAHVTERWKIQYNTWMPHTQECQSHFLSPKVPTKQLSNQLAARAKKCQKPLLNVNS